VINEHTNLLVLVHSLHEPEKKKHFKKETEKKETQQIGVSG
jgi:hypothetical protein